MMENKSISADKVKLRRLAEKAIKETADDNDDLSGKSPEEMSSLIHELRVHQIELEMQNEELRRMHAELENSRDRYSQLYDFAPIGYCTVSEKGMILEANLTAATLLGIERSTLVKSPLSRFILNKDQDVYYRHRKLLFETGEPQACELRMVRTDIAFWVRLASIVSQKADREPICRLVMSDITECKRVEAEKEQLISELTSALGQIKKLRGFLPICSYCKKIRDDKGYWNQIESYLDEHSDAEFSHSICPECAKKYFPDMDIYDEDETQQ